MTSLIDAVRTRSIDVIQSLLDGGANPNETGIRGVTPLHAAISRSGNFDIVRLLIDSGANPNVEYRGMSAIYSAAAYGCIETTKFLIRKVTRTKIQKIEVFELIGSAILGRKNHPDIARDYRYLFTGMKMRFRDPENPLPKNVLPRISAYGGRIECQSISELEKIQNNPDLLHLEAFMIWERILGRSNSLVIRYLLHSYISYSSPNQTGMLLKRWHRAIANILSLQDESIHSALQYVFELLLKIPLENITCGDLVGFIQSALIQFGQLKRLTNVESLVNQKALESLITSLLSFMSFSLELGNMDKKDCRYLGSVAYSLIRECQVILTVPLMHMMFDRERIPQQFKIGRSHFPSEHLIKLLVLQGLDTNAVDHRKDTFLHVMASQYPQNEDLETFSDVIHVLIDHGLHLHKENAKGEPVRDILMRRKRSEASMAISKRSLSLKCDAARIVKRFKSPYKGIVPRDLYDVIECE